MSATAAVRPASFDARLIAYLPGLQALSGRLCPEAERQDLINETLTRILERWASFREDGGFYSWLKFTMRGVARDRRKRAMQAAEEPLEAADLVTVEPSQFGSAAARQALAKFGSGRESQLLLRLAAGDTLQQIGDDFGISRERVRQITKKERIAFAKRVRHGVPA